MVYKEDLSQLTAEMSWTQREVACNIVFPQALRIHGEVRERLGYNYHLPSLGSNSFSNLKLKKVDDLLGKEG